MKRIFGGLLAILFMAFMANVSAKAEDIDFSRIRCGDFVSQDKDDVILMLTWIEGYFTPRSGPPIMYGQKAKEDAENIRNYCLNNSDADVFTAAKKVIPIK